MTVEQKAKAYDYALEGIQEILSSGQNTIKMSRLKLRLQGIFPELKESDDERISKEIIEYFKVDFTKGIARPDWIAWLEKIPQRLNTKKTESEPRAVEPSELTNQEEDDTSFRWYACIKDFHPYKNDNLYKFKSDEILDKEYFRPIKFEVGDWITNGHYTKNIVGINNRRYLFEDGTDKYYYDTDKKYHLWTIEDAKDGDVLYSADVNTTFIFKCIDKDKIRLYCDVYRDVDLSEVLEICGEIHSFGHVYDATDIHPAFQSQRNAFFKILKENGYEWDAAKKELRKLTYYKENCKGYQETGKCVADEEYQFCISR